MLSAGMSPEERSPLNRNRITPQGTSTDARKIMGRLISTVSGLNRLKAYI